LAITAACTRELTSSLRRMCCTWILTVVSAMSSSRAISLLLAPRAMAAQDLALARRQQGQRRPGALLVRLACRRPPRG
jgi:hypothetical protein